MELLARESAVFDEHPDRSFFFVEAKALPDLPLLLRPDSKHFVLFIAANVEGLTEGETFPLLSRLIDSGLASCCTWGPGSKDLETWVDHAAI
jgi:hypothetical protein